MLTYQNRNSYVRIVSELFSFMSMIMNFFSVLAAMFHTFFKTKKEYTKRLSLKSTMNCVSDADATYQLLFNKHFRMTFVINQ